MIAIQKLELFQKENRQWCAFSQCVIAIILLLKKLFCKIERNVLWVGLGLIWELNKALIILQLFQGLCNTEVIETVVHKAIIQKQY
jgi:hypothetical protein